MFIMLSLFGWIEKIARLISPTVVGVYLILLVAQLSGSFLQGMTGLNEQTTIHTKMLCLSIIMVLLSYGFMKLPHIGHYAVLFTIVFGWILFHLFDFLKLIIYVVKILIILYIIYYG